MAVGSSEKERLYVRVDKDTKEKIAQLAEADNRSITNYISNILIQHIKTKESEK
jgi:uncharacterized protein (DUF1778 family)